jgi:DNA invertase Pin-like site-specific DNA recombinase
MDTTLRASHADESGREGTQIGYASYSTREGRACLDAQLAELECSGCKSTGCEEVGSSWQRKVLARFLRHLKSGDVLTVTKLDRLARSAQEATDVIQALHSKGATVRILNLDVETRTAAGKRLLQFLAATAEMEQAARLDKQHEDKQRTVSFLSRDINIRVLALENLARVDALKAEGLTWAQMARRLGLSEVVVRHACNELRSRQEFDHPKLESELSRLRERMAVILRMPE